MQPSDGKDAAGDSDASMAPAEGSTASDNVRHCWMNRCLDTICFPQSGNEGTEGDEEGEEGESDAEMGSDGKDAKAPAVVHIAFLSASRFEDEDGDADVIGRENFDMKQNRRLLLRTWIDQWLASQPIGDQPGLRQRLR